MNNTDNSASSTQSPTPAAAPDATQPKGTSYPTELTMVNNPLQPIAPRPPQAGHQSSLYGATPRGSYNSSTHFTELTTVNNPLQLIAPRSAQAGHQSSLYGATPRGSYNSPTHFTELTTVNNPLQPIAPRPPQAGHQSSLYGATPRGGYNSSTQKASTKRKSSSASTRANKRTKTQKKPPANPTSNAPTTTSTQTPKKLYKNMNEIIKINILNFGNIEPESVKIGDKLTLKNNIFETSFYKDNVVTVTGITKTTYEKRPTQPRDYILTVKHSDG